MRAQRVQRLFYSYVKGFSPDSRELAEAGFVWKQDGENAELAFPGEKASLWENYVAAHLPCGYWNEYLQEDSVVFLFQLPDGFRRILIRWTQVRGSEKSSGGSAYPGWRFCCARPNRTD